MNIASEEGAVADADKLTLRKLTALVEKLREVQAQTCDIAEEMQRLLSGDPGIGARMKQVELAWQTAWGSRYHAEYVFNYTVDRAHLKRLLKTFTPADLQIRILNYIKSEDQFCVSRRHPFALFVATVNQHAPVTEFDLAPSVDCRHTPRCRTDEEHTVKRGAEMRA